MLVNLPPNIEEIERRKIVAKEHDFEYVPQSDPQWLQETGIYQSRCSHNFDEEEFMEKLYDNYNEKLYEINKKEGETLFQHYSKNYKKMISEYGVADNIEQIKKFYNKQIKDKKNKFVIAVSPVYQEKENKGNGWRWEKWGDYIGELDSQHDYLNDENFGEDFEYIICFQLYFVE